MAARIRLALDDLERQPYWLEIQEQTLVRLSDVLEESLVVNAGERDVSQLIERMLGGEHARAREADCPYGNNRSV